MSAAAAFCPGCGTAVPADAQICPYCRSPQAAGGIVRSSGADAMDRHVEARLARLRTEDLLASADTFETLLAPLSRDARTGVLPGDLYQAMARVEDAAVPSLQRLESLLALDGAELRLEGIDLSSLVERSSSEQTLLRRGLTFLKHRRYDEAVEWWAINRQELGPNQGRLDLLLLLLEAFTHRLAGDKDRAERCRTAVLVHPSLPRAAGAARSERSR